MPRFDGPRRRFIRSGARAWIATDRACGSSASPDRSAPSAAGRPCARNAEEVCRLGWREEQQSFTQY
ncbi:hypothetical protein [Streptomyces roseoviridis]|uniref:hypothetical protein n=1 Tax=Streptomyces roseoviridis TaxID=67361 RepID=UPI0031E8C9F3